jgi:hypothetical protein
MDDKDSQCKIILVWLKEKGCINAKIARQLCACERLAARIKDLRNAGIPIKTEMNTYISSKTGRPVRYAVYRLEENNA